MCLSRHHWGTLDIHYLRRPWDNVSCVNSVAFHKRLQTTGGDSFFFIFFKSKIQKYYFEKLERKRHIGNDIVTVVFQNLDNNVESDFTPSSARSQFQHIFALVTYNKEDNSYRLVNHWIWLFDSLICAFSCYWKVENIFGAISASIWAFVAQSASIY